MVALRDIMEFSVQDIYKNPALNLPFLKYVSLLLLNGAIPKACIKTGARYYNELSRLNYSECKILAIMEKTCILKGIIFVVAEGMYFSNANLTDEKAVKFLENGFMQEKHFTRLPAGYASKGQRDIIDPPKINTTRNVPFKKHVKK